MSDENKKTILIFGITGRQGSSVARELLNENRYKLRALVRDKSDEKIQEFQKRGGNQKIKLVEFFLGNLNDKKSILKAMNGVYGG
jgi:uncharacterized protein YbjT (DUF2867 family)